MDTHRSTPSTPRVLRIGLVALGVIGACAPGAGSRAGPAPHTTRSAPASDVESVSVIRDVWLWDGVEPEGQPHRSVVIRGGRIAKVGPAAAVAVPSGARVLDGRGLYLIPGLWDMHVHALWAPDVPRAFLPLFVAHGVTGIRDMGGTLEVLAQAREELRRGEYASPRMVVAGRILDGPEPVHADISLAIGSGEEARAAVHRLARADVDFLKVYTLLPPAAFSAVMEEAEERSLPVAGHVPYQVGPVAAARAGMRSMEHTMNEVGGFCAPDRPDECTRIFDAFREHGTWQTPVLAVERRVSAESIARDPRLSYMPGSVIRYWFDGGLDQLRPAGRPRDADDPADSIDLPEEAWLTAKLYEAGVAILAGSDTGVPYSLPGWGLHTELELLVAAGLSPSAALVAATRGPAEYLGRIDDLGTVEVGKKADLVLLRENPLEDIRNSRTVETVILDGAVLDRTALDGILARLASTAAERQ